MRIRLATASDLPAIMEIYNEQVLHGVATFDTEPVDTPAKQSAWLAKHPPERYPVLVAEEDERVIGWASLSRWSERCAYDRSAEVSEYVHKDHRGRGVGSELLRELIARARVIGLGVLLARITGESAASLRMHADHGFTRVGTMRRVGQKFGRILDVEVMDLQLDGGAPPAGSRV